MATLEGTNISAPVVPFDSQDTYPTHDSKYGRGGWREVSTLAERNAIPADRLRNGCVCYVEETGFSYIYKSGVWNSLLDAGGACPGIQKYTTVSYTGVQINIAGKDYPFAKVYISTGTPAMQYLNICGTEEGDCGKILFFQSGSIVLRPGKTGMNGSSGSAIQGTIDSPSNPGSIFLVEWWTLAGGQVCVSSQTLLNA